MPFRIREVLLVSSLYDSFILEEDGHISELLLQEYRHLNLSYAPRITRAATAEDAMELLESGRRFDLVLTTMRLGELDPVRFARLLKAKSPLRPVVLLGYDNRELERFVKDRSAAIDSYPIDRVFVWNGDARILLAIVNTIEDQLNAPHDTAAAAIETILFVEDDIRFASAYLPMLYAELMKQSQSLIAEGVNLTDKVMRMRARPKILWCETFERACATYDRYRGAVLGVISDVSFPKNGVTHPEAGFEFIRYVRADDHDLPVLLQSQEMANIEQAVELEASFVHKQSPWLPQDVRRFMLEYFGFGPFIFRMPDGREVDRARDIRELKRKLAVVPDDSLRYHAEHNHFSNWFKARTEFRLADRLRPVQVEDFTSILELRKYLVYAMADCQRSSQRGRVADFHRDTFDPVTGFARIGGGSIGGKGRGLAFLNRLLTQMEAAEDWRETRVTVPPTVVIATDLFDRFIDENHLTEVVLSGADDDAIRDAFLAAPLPQDLVGELASLVDLMNYPLAVRSSSILEDSLDLPFAGVYETYMVPNTSDSRHARLEDLCSAVKLVYASTFSTRARAYLESSPQRPEMERMAIVIQRLIGRRYGDRFYPNLAGVARSHNYYPTGRASSEDGVAFVALGMGKTVVEGRGALRFCPKYPQHLPQFSQVQDILDNSQKEFFALQLNRSDYHPRDRFTLVLNPMNLADDDGTLAPVASTYSPENNIVTEGAGRDGVPIVTFASVLKHGLFPLAELLTQLLQHGQRGMSLPVEIEFALNFGDAAGRAPEFACLQIRPLVVMSEAMKVDEHTGDPQKRLCFSSRALGNGRISGIRDIVMVDPDRFDRRLSHETAVSVGQFNAKLRTANRPYLLIGPGRWGSADPWLGIPVNWGQISGVSVIVETGWADRPVTPSEGSHFFQNMTSFRVGYLTVNMELDEGYIDWAWLRKQPTVDTAGNGLRWIQLDSPLDVRIDGRSNRAVILKPDDG